VLSASAPCTAQTQGASGNFSITIATPKGCQWLASPNPAALLVMLPSHMEEEETCQRRRQAAEAQRAAERQAAQQKRDEEAGEKQQLLVALRASRKAKADELGQVRLYRTHKRARAELAGHGWQWQRGVPIHVVFHYLADLQQPRVWRCTLSHRDVLLPWMCFGAIFACRYRNANQVHTWLDLVSCCACSLPRRLQMCW